MTLIAKDKIGMFRAAVLKSALKLYGENKIITNRSLTPMKMLTYAEEITGEEYKRGDYLVAAGDIERILHILTSSGGTP